MQKKIIIEKLKLDGFVSRNWALSKYISRLSAIILTLKNEGWQLQGKQDKGDYIYEVVGSPYQKVYYKLPDGQIITKYELKTRISANNYSM